MSGNPGGSRRVKYLAVLAIVLFVSAAIAGYYSFGMEASGTNTTSSTISSTTSSSSSTCATAPLAKDQQLSPTTFDAITEYSVSANRTPTGIAVAPDGSMWFGEWGLPGVGHLFPNGTLTEYKWPYSYDSVLSECGQDTQIWGVALWNGSVWGADNLYSRLISVNPSTGQTQEVNLTSGTDPYTLTVGNGDLWFTVDASPGLIGKLSPNSTSVQYYSLPNTKNTESIYILFQNSTLAYVLSIDESNLTPVLYSFNPTSTSPTFAVAGGNQTIYEPSGLALADGGIWATEHAASAMAFLNFTTDRWTIYPTSTVPYVPVILTYFDGSNGTAVWFNEHYSNRMGVITGDGRYLTEYSITDPPIFNITTILENYNLVTMGLATDGAWFAAATADIVGFVNASYHPPFSISANATSVNLAPGGSTEVGINYTGNVTGSNLSLQFEDNEFNNGTAKLMSFVPGAITTSPTGVSTFTLTISASSSLQPGEYIAAATVTNGSIYRTVYFTVVVT
jgi:streptogramin lyase